MLELRPAHERMASQEGASMIERYIEITCDVCGEPVLVRGRHAHARVQAHRDPRLAPL